MKIYLKLMISCFKITQNDVALLERKLAECMLSNSSSSSDHVAR